MSITHYFYVKNSLQVFPKKLLAKLEEEKEKYNRQVMQSELNETHIYFSLRSSRPNEFYITTIPDDSLLNIMDQASFTFVNYHHNADNRLVIRLALICKYYLKEHFCIRSDGFYCGIDDDWYKIIEELNNEGYDLTIKNEYDNKASFIIDGQEIDNGFDEDGLIFNKMFNVSYINNEGESHE